MRARRSGLLGLAVDGDRCRRAARLARRPTGGVHGYALAAGSVVDPDSSRRQGAYRYTRINYACYAHRIIKPSEKL